MEEPSNRGSMYDLKTLADGSDEDWLYSPSAKNKSATSPDGERQQQQQQQQPRRPSHQPRSPQQPQRSSKLKDEINVRDWLREDNIPSEDENDEGTSDADASDDADHDGHPESPTKPRSSPSHAGNGTGNGASDNTSPGHRSRSSSRKNSFFHPIGAAPPSLSPDAAEAAHRISLRLSHLFGDQRMDDLNNIEMDLRPISLTDLKVDLDVMDKKEKQEKNRRAMLLDRERAAKDADDEDAEASLLNLDSLAPFGDLGKDFLSEQYSPLRLSDADALDDVLNAYSAVTSPPDVRRPSAFSERDMEPYSTAPLPASPTHDGHLTTRRFSASSSSAASQVSSHSQGTSSAGSSTTRTAGVRLPYPSSRSGSHSSTNLPRSSSSASQRALSRQTSSERLPPPSAGASILGNYASAMSALPSPHSSPARSNSQTIKPSSSLSSLSIPTSPPPPMPTRSKSPLPMPSSPASRRRLDNASTPPEIPRAKSPFRSTTPQPPGFTAEPMPTGLPVRSKTPVSSLPQRTAASGLPAPSAPSRPKTPVSRSTSSSSSLGIPHQSSSSYASISSAPSTALPARSKSPMPSPSSSRRQRAVSNASSTASSVPPASSGIPRPKTPSGLSSSASASSLLPSSYSSGHLNIPSRLPTPSSQSSRPPSPSPARARSPTPGYSRQG
ncbi:hypothetical protein RI367_006869 [Sorochytrium milnesiophthora]